MSDEKKCTTLKTVGFVLLVINTVLLALILMKLCCMSSQCGMFKAKGFCPYSTNQMKGSMPKGS